MNLSSFFCLLIVITIFARGIQASSKDGARDERIYKKLCGDVVVPVRDRPVKLSCKFIIRIAHNEVVVVVNPSETRGERVILNRDTMKIIKKKACKFLSKNVVPTKIVFSSEVNGIFVTDRSIYISAWSNCYANGDDLR